MIIADVPTKLDIIWASGTTSTYVRAIPNTSSDPNAASLTLGFPPNTFVDVTSGGEPPDGRDWNGILQVLSAWSQWLSAGGAGAILYDSGFSAAVGGYPKYALLAAAAAPGTFWISTVDNNTSDPDTGGANWSAFPPAFGSFVSSFNGRTGAVTLTSSDVVSALAANALPNSKLALRAALSVFGNPTASPATGVDMSILQLLSLMGLTANLNSTGHVTIPVYFGGVLQLLIIQWGFANTGGSSATISFDIPFPNAVFAALATGNFTAPATVENLTQTGMKVNSGSPNTGAWYAVVGY